METASFACWSPTSRIVASKLTKQNVFITCYSQSLVSTHPQLWLSTHDIVFFWEVRTRRIQNLRMLQPMPPPSPSKFNKFQHIIVDSVGPTFLPSENAHLSLCFWDFGLSSRSGMMVAHGIALFCVRMLLLGLAGLGLAMIWEVWVPEWAMDGFWLEVGCRRNVIPFAWGYWNQREAVWENTTGTVFESCPSLNSLMPEKSWKCLENTEARSCVRSPPARASEPSRPGLRRCGIVPGVLPCQPHTWSHPIPLHLPSGYD